MGESPIQNKSLPTDNYFHATALKALDEKGMDEAVKVLMQADLPWRAISSLR